MAIFYCALESESRLSLADSIYAFNPNVALTPSSVQFPLSKLKFLRDIGPGGRKNYATPPCKGIATTVLFILYF